MAKGTLHFYHSNDLGGWIIDWRTGGQFSHVCIEIHPATHGIDNGEVIEARWPKVSRGTIGTPAASFTPIYGEEKLDKAITWIQTTIGDTYDVLDILANAVILFWPHAPLIHTPTAFTCSELAGTFLVHAGYIFPEPYQSDERSLSVLSPNDLARMFRLI